MSGVNYRFITDHLGSVRMVVNSSTGAIAQEINYDEFGVETSNSNPGFQPFGYAGGLVDEQTKLVRFGARDYDASIGRWTAKDPIGFSGGFNFYTFVDADPLNKVDPSGLFDVNAAVETLDNNAQPRSTGKCAAYVRKALEAGGANTDGHPLYAKDYGATLSKNEFEDLGYTPANPQPGDVVVLDPPESSSTPAGHIQMWDGSQWVSDFKQKDFYPGPGYRNDPPDYTYYRNSDQNSGACACQN